MISASDRQRAIELMTEAHQAGARRHRACQKLGLTLRTIQRWTRQGTLHTDARPTAVRPTPRHQLSREERAQVWAVCHEQKKRGQATLSCVSPAHSRTVQVLCLAFLVDKPPDTPTMC